MVSYFIPSRNLLLLPKQISSLLNNKTEDKVHLDVGDVRNLAYRSPCQELVHEVLHIDLLTSR